METGRLFLPEYSLVLKASINFPMLAFLLCLKRDQVSFKIGVGEKEALNKAGIRN